MTTKNETLYGIRASDYNTLREAIATAIGLSAKHGEPHALHVHDFDLDAARAVLAGWCSAQSCGGREFVGTDLTSGRFATVELVEVRA